MAKQRQQWHRHLLLILFFILSLLAAKSQQQQADSNNPLQWICKDNTLKNCQYPELFCTNYYAFRAAASMPSYPSNMFCSLSIVPLQESVAWWWANVDGIVLSVKTTMEPDVDYALIRTCVQGSSCTDRYRINSTFNEADPDFFAKRRYVANRNGLNITLPNPVPPTYYIELQSISNREYDSICHDASSCYSYQNNNDPPTMRYTGVDFSYTLTCKPGFYADYFDGPIGGSCAACPAGKFSAVSGAVGLQACQWCPAPMYQPNAGQTACMFCSQPGYTGLGFGATKCSTCPAGIFSPLFLLFYYGSSKCFRMMCRNLRRRRLQQRWMHAMLAGHVQPFRGRRFHRCMPAVPSGQILGRLSPNNLPDVLGRRVLR
jgi:hypothetical protein